MTSLSISDTQSENVPEQEDDALDPRVQVELERLNYANEAINKLELQLDEARKVLQEFSDTLEQDLITLEKKIGSAVGKAKNYYDARIKLRDVKETLTKAKHRFERAQALHVAAKELAVVSADYIDEYQKSNQNTQSWNETYGQAIAKAADAEREKYEADQEQQKAQNEYEVLEKLVEKLQKDYRRSINKSKLYYEMKADFHKELEFQKRKVYGLENCVCEAKAQYQESLRNLEKISNEIHEQRKQTKTRRELGERTAGVGSEEPSSVIETEKQFISTPPKSNPPLPFNLKTDDPTLKKQRDALSYFLRTEKLPAGVFTLHDRDSPEGGETPTNNSPSFAPSKPIVCPLGLTVPSSDASSLTNESQSQSNYRRKISDVTSITTTSDYDEEDTDDVLSVLNDEQIEHLAGLHFYEKPTQPTGMETKLSDDLLNSLSNPHSKLVMN